MATSHTDFGRAAGEPTAEEKVIHALLESRVLGRSEHLRRILRYITDEECAGRGASLSEYEIGVHALGRPDGYSPDTDSSVRTRMHELRRRLEEHYASEGQASAVRVQIPKGSFRPVFVHSAPADLPSPPTQLPPPRRLHFWLGLAAGFALACVLGALTWLSLRPKGPEEALRTVWGPLLEADSQADIALASPPQIWLRNLGAQPTPLGDPPVQLPIIRDPEILRWYNFITRENADSIFPHINAHSPLWGDCMAAAQTARFLAAHGVNANLIPEPSIRPESMRDRNLVLIGRSDYSRSVAGLEPARGFRTVYHAGDRQVGILWHGAPPPPSGAPPGPFHRGSSGRINYGLITILSRTRQDDRTLRTIILSGINSDGAQAGAEFLVSASKVKPVLEQLRAAGHSGLPRALQIVVKTLSHDTYSMETSYVSHVVLEK
ncbi:MAG TPA: hypothetical protein DEH78_11305 [Solibacterales bacterium]|nr:hypothetical protein [Bryobacterales bacterium]